MMRGRVFLAELMTIFYCLRFETPLIGNQVPVFISGRNKVVELYPQALGSVFVASYDSKGYGDDIRTQPHALPPLYSRGMDHAAQKTQLPYSCRGVKSKFKVTLRLVVYRQSVCLGVKPLETPDQNFFPPN
jgi:hypothetical protein